MQQPELIPHLYRTEFRKITAVLAKTFGFGQIEIAEDIVADTFLKAAENWKANGLPDNPAAWLYTVAKNQARDQLKRLAVFESKVTPTLQTAQMLPQGADIDLSDKNINDSQLQMMFAICNPVIPPEAQISLSLRILCGFGIEEIADAFLSNKETINKRLYRAKEKLKAEGVKIELPKPPEIETRLNTVLTTLYLLFNQGYYPTTTNTSLRKDFCLEAMRLTYLLVANKSTNKPAVNALLALMCYHASRFDARTGPGGELVLYEEQNTSLWNDELIARGHEYFKRAARGNELSKYHFEAAIAHWHTKKPGNGDKWEQILQLYNKLLMVEYSPIAALNRTYALYKVHGPQRAIGEAEHLNLAGNQLYHALLGKLYSGYNNAAAAEHLNAAIGLAKHDADKQNIRKMLDELNEG